MKILKDSGFTKLTYLWLGKEYITKIVIKLAVME